MRYDSGASTDTLKDWEPSVKLICLKKGCAMSCEKYQSWSKNMLNKAGMFPRHY